MAIEKIAEMFAELGFKVDTKGLIIFEKHLSKLKEDFAGVKSATIKYTDQTVKSDKLVARSSRTKTNALIADRKRLSQATATSAASIDKMFGIGRKRSPLADQYSGIEAADGKTATKDAARATREKAAADKVAARASSKHSQALDAIVRRMSPLQHEYQDLKRHQDMLNKEMVQGTGDARRYESSLARIQARMKQLDAMRVNGNLPFKESMGGAGRPSRSGVGVSGGAGMFGAFGAIAAGIGTNRLQVSTEQTQAKMGMVLSPEESAKQIKFASDNARALGTNAIAAAAGYADLMVQATRMEIPMADTQNLFMGVSEASVAMGLSMDQQKGIYKAFSDMLAKGTVNAEELKGQLGDRLPGAVKLAADSMEITSQELMKMMENNELLAKDFLPKFAIAMRASVREGDALNKMMQGTQSQMGRFGNAVNDAAMAFSRGGFNKAFLEFLAQATKSMNAMISSGFFDALGFGFRMLMMPIRAAMEVVEGLSGIFKKASDEGGVYQDVLTKIAVVLGVLLLPALLSIGRALAPFILMTAGLLALGDIMEGLAGNSSEFSDNWIKLTESIRNGKTDWEAFGKIATEVGVALAGILVTTLALRKLNPFKGKGSVVPSTTGTAAKTASGGLIGALARRALGVVGLGIGSDGVGAGSDQIYNADGSVKSEFSAYNPNISSNPDLPMFGANNRIDNLNRVSGGMPSLPNFDANNRMTQETRRLPSSYTNSSSSSSASSVTIANMNINGESAPENLRTNMESYMNGLLGEVFTDAMRETIR